MAPRQTNTRSTIIVFLLLAAFLGRAEGRKWTDLRALATATVHTPSPLPGQPAESGSALVAAMTSAVSPNTWDVVGGAGAARVFHGAAALVVAQTEPGHERVAIFLARTRAACAAQSPSSRGTVVSQQPTPSPKRKPRPGSAAEYPSGTFLLDPFAESSLDDGDDVFGPLTPASPAAALQLKYYPLSFGPPNPNAASYPSKDLVNVIRKAIEPKSWELTAGVVIEPLGNGLVIRHTPAVHEQVQRLLTTVGLYAPPNSRGMGGMGGGMGGYF